MSTSKSLFSLSDELLVQICEHLYLPDLQNFASSSRRLLNACSKPVLEHRNLQKKYSVIYGHKSKFGSWLYPVVFALRDHRVAYYVENIVISSSLGGDICWELLRGDGRAEESLEMICDALRQSALYTMQNRVGHKSDLDRIMRGNDDTLLSLLISLLPNLRRITLPAYHNNTMMDLTRTFARVRNIALNWTDEFPNNLSINGVAPLGNLESIDAFESHGREHENLDEIFVGVELEHILPFFSLPNIKRARLLHTHQLYFDGPADIPKSRVCEVTISGGKVSCNVVVVLASYMIGPCVIRQENRLPCQECEECTSQTGRNCLCDWESLEIPHKDATEGDWIKIGACWEVVS